jgi:hypothetical protein
MRFDRQAKIAGNQPGYTPKIISEALDFPEFKTPAAGGTAKTPKSITLKSGKVVTVTED